VDSLHGSRDRSDDLAGTRPTAKEAGSEIRTFLIADVRGYTMFTQERGDEAAARLAARFAAIVREHVEARDGSVIELRGDEALAVFASPRQAIRAAVDLQDRFLRETTEAPDLPLAVGIGLDAGEAVPVGDGFRGGALNTAARLCSVAAPGEILGSESVVHLARTVEGVTYDDRGALRLKGLAEPVDVSAIASGRVDVPRQMRSLGVVRPARRTHRGAMQFRVLGPLEVDAGSGPIALGGPKQRAVLAHLLLRSNQLVPSATLIDELWGDEPPETARNTLQTYMSHLRKALGEGRLIGRSPGYVLSVDPSELDSSRFDDLVREAKKALAVDPSVGISLLDDALALWRGPALADVAGESSLLAEAARLDDLRLAAQEERIEGLLGIGQTGRAVGEAETLLARHPLRERPWGQLMLALYREGRQADALAAFQRAREVLADELGIDPSPELARLHERILGQDAALDLRGEPLRGYRLMEKIGEGPAGVVFRGLQPRVERDVAVKVLHHRLVSDGAFVRRFEPEAQAVVALEHPHIVPLFDYWREPDGAYVVTRYMRGGSLRALEERGEALPQDRRATIVRQVASALAFAHRQGIAHGNVRTSNVLFDAEANAYLGDFRIGVGAPATIEDDLEQLDAIARRLVGDVPGILGWLEAGDGASGAAALVEALLPGKPSAREALVGGTDARNPYKGLRPFGEADAGDFFGRGELVDRLTARLNERGPESRFLSVVGPSGSGKSSVVRAGLVPAIRAGALADGASVLVGELFPGTHPFDELEAALLRLSAHPIPRLRDRLEEGSRGLLEVVGDAFPEESEVVVVVDQFEEVFTLTRDVREREAFLEALRVATVDPASRIRVIVTLRADFFDRPLATPRFGELLGRRTETVTPLTPDELEQAIRGPAERVGVPPEPGLVAEIVADVVHQPGALPLLQYALTELFERREDERLRLEPYVAMGGVAGAVSARADRLYEASGPEGRRAIRQVLLRLVTLGEGRQDTRRRVARSELDVLDVDPEAVDGVLEAYGRHRLLTFDREPTTREPTVEIAHEALLTSWNRLRTWIDEAREGLRLERQVAQAGAEWRGADRDGSFLLRGTRLDQAAAWAERTDLAVGAQEREFLKASVDHRAEELAEEAERGEREARVEGRSRSRLRTLVAVLTAAALVASALTVVAKNQRDRAEHESRTAAARELAAASVANLDLDPERSILLALESIERTRSADGSVLPEAWEALHRAVTASRIVLSVDGLGGALDWSPRGVFVTEGPEDSGIIDIRDVRTGKPALPPFRGTDVDINDVAFSSDGSILATSGDDGALKLWDPTGELLSTTSGGGSVRGISFAASGSRLSAAWTDDGAVRILDPSTGRVIRSIPVDGGPRETALSPDGRLVAVSSTLFNDVLVYDVDSGERPFTLRGHGNLVPGIAWSPDGERIATGSNDASVRIWNGDTGELEDELLGHTGFVTSVEWSPEGSHLVTSGSDGTVRVWDVGGVRGQELMSLAGQGTGAGLVAAFSPDGTKVITGDGAIRSTKVWDVSIAGDAEWANVGTNLSDVGVAFLPSGHVAVPVDRGAVAVSEITGAGEARRIRTIGPAGGSSEVLLSLSASADGSRLATLPYHSTVATVWDLATGERLFEVEPGGELIGVELSEDGEHLLVTSFDGTATVHDAKGEELRRLGFGDFFLVSGSFSPDGRLVATLSQPRNPLDAKVTLWDWQRDRVVNEIENSGGGTMLAFDPSGATLAIGRWDGFVHVVDVGSGDRLLRFSATEGIIRAIEYGPDGRTIATGGDDGAVRLFDADDGTRQLILRGHRSGVFGLSFSSDGTRLASASSDGVVRVWALDLDDLIGIARHEVTRSLTDEECRQYLHQDGCPADEGFDHGS